MLTNGVVTSKLRHLEEVLAELRSLGTLTLERLQAEWVIRRAVERDLQLAIEVLIDVYHRVLALKGATPPATSRAALLACEHLGMLASAEKYRPLVGFCREALSGQLLLRRDPAAHAQFVSRICRLAEVDQWRLRQGLIWWREAHPQ